MPVELSTDDQGAPIIGLTTTPDVDGADEEVVWAQSQLESSSLHNQGIKWIIRGFFGHTFRRGKV